MVEGKLTGQTGNFGGTAGAVLLCPTPLPYRTPRERDSESYRLEGKQHMFLPLSVCLLTQLFTV